MMAEKHEDREEARKRTHRRIAAGIGAGLMATGAGLSGLGLWKTRASANAAQVARQERAFDAIKKGPIASDPLEHLKALLREKGYPDASRMQKVAPLANIGTGNAGVMPAPFNLLVGGSRIPKKVLEHEAGHLVGKNQAGFIGRILGMHGINYGKNILKPELDAWRHAKPGTTRRNMRRAAISVYKGAGPIIQGRALFRAGLLPLAVGTGLTGGALISALGRTKKKKKKE